MNACTWCFLLIFFFPLFFDRPFWSDFRAQPRLKPVHTLSYYIHTYPLYRLILNQYPHTHTTVLHIYYVLCICGKRHALAGWWQRRRRRRRRWKYKLCADTWLSLYPDVCAYNIRIRYYTHGQAPGPEKVFMRTRIIWYQPLYRSAPPSTLTPIPRVLETKYPVA